MRQRIDELKLHASITLLGRREDVLHLMEISSLLLLTSRFEGMPNVVMEAQAVGIPVVAPDVGGVADCMIDGRTGYLVEPDDTDAFAQRCIELIENEELRRKFGASGAAHMRHSFSRRVMAQCYLDVLEVRGSAEDDASELVRATAA